MARRFCVFAAVALAGSALPVIARGQGAPTPAPVTVAELAGAWSGTASHRGETTPVALELEPVPDGKILVKVSIPAIHLFSVPLGAFKPEISGEHVRFGPFALERDRTADTLHGTVPDSLAPLYQLPLELHRVERVQAALRGGPEVPSALPTWKFAAGAPLWPGTSFSGSLVFAGGEDGRLHALEARTGKERWSFKTGGAIRARAVVAGPVAFVQADDGFLYALQTSSGALRWRVKVVPEKILRLPPSNPETHYDRFASDVVPVGDRLYLGTHDGRVLCLAAKDGAGIWELKTGGSVLAAPTIDAGRVFAGSYDGRIYAMDATTGKLAWKRDTGKPVVSTPAVAGNRVVVGSRSFDLLGLDAASGEVVWQQYLWFSWVESSPVVRDGVAYVGSSDAAVLSAYDATSGRRVWVTDVWGWAWGQSTVTERRVYIGTAAQRGYPALQRAQALAVDRFSGQIAWSFAMSPPGEGTFGFAGSPSVGAGMVFFAGLDGTVYAFPE